MGKPYTHCLESVKYHKGKPEDYLEIHEHIDDVKGILPDNRGRAITHNAHYIYHVLPRIFGTTITNSDGIVVSVSQIGEEHVLSDFRQKCIPTVQDWLGELPMRDWMNNCANGDLPPSMKSVEDSKKKLNISEPSMNLTEEINFVLDGSRRHTDIEYMESILPDIEKRLQYVNPVSD